MSYGQAQDGFCSCRGTNHFFQSDGPFTIPRAFARALVKDPLPPDMIEDIVAYQVNRDVCHTFFKRYLLKGASNSPSLLASYPGLPLFFFTMGKLIKGEGES